MQEDEGIELVEHIEPEVDGTTRGHSLLATEPPLPEHVSWWAAWFNICNVTIGAGILALPYVLRLTGLVLGVLLILAMGLLADYTLRILLLGAQITGGLDSLQEVVRFSFGNRWATFVNVMTIIYCFMMCVSYTILGGDLTTPVIQNWTGSTESFFVSRIFIMGFSNLLIIFPLSLYRRLHFLRHISVIAMGCIAYLVILVIAWAFEHKFNDVHDGNIRNDDEVAAHELHFFLPSEKIFFALPIVAFAYASHLQVYTIYAETGFNNVDKMMGVVHYVTGFCTVLYCTVAIFGYLTFRGVTEGNIFNNYVHVANSAISFGKIALAFAVIFSGPFYIYPLRENMVQLVWPAQVKGYRLPDMYHVLITITPLALALVIGSFVPKVEDVIAFTGSTCITLVMYILPAMIFLKLASLETQPAVVTSRRRSVLVMLSFGVLLGLGGTLMSLLQMVGIKGS